LDEDWGDRDLESECYDEDYVPDGDFAQEEDEDEDFIQEELEGYDTEINCNLSSFIPKTQKFSSFGCRRIGPY
jgi:hypothetical protein